MQNQDDKTTGISSGVLESSTSGKSSVSILVSNKYFELIKSNKLLTLAFILFIVSLFLPCIFYSPSQFDSNPSPSYGLFLLGLGWLGVFDGIFAWYANLLVIFIIRGVSRNSLLKKVIMAIVTILLASSTFTITSMLANENGGRMSVDHLGIGFYFWFVSIILVAVHSMLGKKVVGVNTEVQINQQTSKGSEIEVKKPAKSKLMWVILVIFIIGIVASILRSLIFAK